MHAAACVHAERMHAASRAPRTCSRSWNSSVDLILRRRARFSTHLQARAVPARQSFRPRACSSACMHAVMGPDKRPAGTPKGVGPM